MTAATPLGVWGRSVISLGQTKASVAASVVVASAYGWGPIPMMSAYDKATGLPVLPWNRSVQ